MKVLIPQDITEAGKKYLAEAGLEYMVGTGYDEETMCREIADCDALLIRTAQVSEKVMEAGKNLKVIGRHGVGVDNLDLEAATKLGIQVTNSPLSNSDAVAEHTVALILACGHHLTEMNDHVRQGDWELRNRVKLMEASGKTLGLVGLGRIGQSVAKKCALGLDMKVKAYSRSIATMDLPDYLEPATSLDEIFSTSDYVSVHVPLTFQTNSSIDLSCFQKMKPTAFFINTARGEIVCEKDLVKALEDGLIAGAALDVLEKEPPQENHPLFGLPQVILSPHCGALTEQAFDNMGVHAAMGIVSVLRGEKPQWCVNTLP